MHCQKRYESICNSLNNWQMVSCIICEIISPKRTVKSLWTSAEEMKGWWGGVGRAWTRWLVCLPNYRRTTSCECFKFMWELHHTFWYNMHKVALFSPHVSDQACRNLLAAMLVSHSQNIGQTKHHPQPAAHANQSENHIQRKRTSTYFRHILKARR